MDNCLAYLLAHLGFLYRDKGFRIVDSKHSPSFGGDGCLILESEILRLRLVSDRGQLLLDFAGRVAKK
ncbi:MAG: hypothetical protein N2B03_02900 [Boseongicola sp.]